MRRTPSKYLLVAEAVMISILCRSLHLPKFEGDSSDRREHRGAVGRPHRAAGIYGKTWPGSARSELKVARFRRLQPSPGAYLACGSVPVGRPQKLRSCGGGRG